MSGGSWDYFTHRCVEVADDLEADKSALRRAFGKHMQLVAKAMHDIEWVDSCDLGKGDDVEAIRKALGGSYRELELSILLDDGQKLVKELTKLGVKADENN